MFVSYLLNGRGELITEKQIAKRNGAAAAIGLRTCSVGDVSSTVVVDAASLKQKVPNDDCQVNNARTAQ